MAEVQWIKIVPELFDDDKIQLIENMPEGDTILVIWFRLLCFAGKKNNGGVFTLGDKKPYTAEMFATIFHRPVSTIELALDTFESFGMVEKIKGTFTIANWEKHQNVDKLDEIREYNKLKQRESRAKRKLLQSVNDNVNDKSMTSQPCQDIEEEGDKEKESHSIIHSADWQENYVKQKVDESLLEGKDAEIYKEEIKDNLKMECLNNKLSEGIIFMSTEQFGDLCDKLSIDEVHHYFEVIKDCERKGKKFKRKTHYQAILDMAAKDRKIQNN
jgi:predicted phage replisome organizer